MTRFFSFLFFFYKNEVLDSFRSKWYIWRLERMIYDTVYIVAKEFLFWNDDLFITLYFQRSSKREMKRSPIVGNIKRVKLIAHDMHWEIYFVEIFVRSKKVKVWKSNMFFVVFVDNNKKRAKSSSNHTK